MATTRKATKQRPRNRAAQDATLINIRALKARAAKQEARIVALLGRVDDLERTVTRNLAIHERDLKAIAERVGVELGMSS